MVKKKKKNGWKKVGRGLKKFKRGYEGFESGLTSADRFLRSTLTEDPKAYRHALGKPRPIETDELKRYKREIALTKLKRKLTEEKKKSPTPMSFGKISKVFGY